jgi:pimeloyl-ACP methyl ester carboxylesterase
MAYVEKRLEINGIETVVLEAGAGDPLVYLHGAGTVTGFGALLPIAEGNRLIVPNHPGFGLSADDPSITSFDDHLLHNLDLLDALELGEVTLAGHSMGGYLASRLAALQPARVKRLVLVAPWGLRVREHPTVDFLSIPDEDLMGRLSANLAVFEGHIPMPPTPEFFAERYRETTSASRVLWERPYDRKLGKWLHRVTMPTLILWGAEDRIIPAEQAQFWAERISGATVRVLPGVGHLVADESPEAVAALGEFARGAISV